MKQGKFFFFWLIAIFVSVTLAPRFIPQTLFVGSRNNFNERLPRWLYDNPLPRLFWLWGNLDGSHYLSIARDGYYPFEHGFFPLYPMVIRFVHLMTKWPYVISALIVTYVSLFLFFKWFWRLLRLDFSELDSRRIVKTVMLFPVAFYLLAIYTDALFMAFTVLCFWFARKRQWWRAGIAGGLAALARFPGIALFPALLVEWIAVRGKKQPFPFPLFLIPLATFVYLGYVQIAEGDWRFFISSMGVWGQNKFVFPVQTAYRYMKILGASTSMPLVSLVAATEFASSLGVLLLLWWGRRRIRPSYIFYSLTYLAIPLSSGTFQGMPRYVMHAFPVLMILSLLFKKKWYAPILSVFSFLLQLVFVAYFSQGHFIS